MPDASESAKDIGLIDVAIVMVEHIRLLVLVPVLVSVLAFAGSFVITPTFTAKTVLLPPQQQQNSAAMAMQSLGALAGLAGIAPLKSPVDLYVSLMQSVTVSNRIIDAYNLMDVYSAKTRQDAIDALTARVRVSTGKKDGLVTVEVDDVDPKRAASIANEYVDQLRWLTNQLAMTEAQQRRAFFERQLKETRQKLAEAQNDLQGSGIDEGALRAEPKAAADAYAYIKAQVTAAEVRLRSMRSHLTEEAPEFRALQANLAALRIELAKAEAADARAATGGYIDKYRLFKYQENLFELFAKQFELAKLDESREGALVQVVDVASPPERKSRPKRALIAALSGLAAGSLLLTFVFVRHALRSRAHVDGVSAKLTRLRQSWRAVWGRG